MITRLAHVNIISTDLAATERFYCEILGMKKGFDFIKDDLLFGFYVKAGDNTYIEIFQDGSVALDDRAIMRHLCLEVSDLDDAISTIRKRGWPVSDKTLGCDNAWQAWVADPDGLQIELMQYTDISSHFTGKPCIVDW